ncbi:MAG: class I SAM-dependent methyltransferase [Armatimonadetes bacterium]|nr:class I SAM-dependent methyltransferase [Armatimonadota bacterium]
MVFISPLPKKQELNKLYDEDYFQGKGFDPTATYFQEYLDLKKREFQYKYFNFILDLVNDYKLKGNFLDLGCGFGNLLEMAGCRNFIPYGVEISPFAAKYPKEKWKDNIVIGEFKENLFPDNFFEVVTLIEVIEHLTSPIEILKNIYKVLKDNGIILIATGNVESLPAKVLGKFWDYYLIPGHIYYYSPNTISRLLKLAGFKIKRIFPPGELKRSKIFNLFEKQKLISNCIKLILFLREKILTSGMIIIAGK